MTVERVGIGRWQTRLRYGSGRRDRFVFSAPSMPAAEAREARLVALAEALRSSGAADAKGVLELAAAAPTEAAFEAVEAEVLARAETVARAGGVPPDLNKTFSDVAELLFADQLRRGNSERTIDGDRRRLRTIAPRIGGVPVRQITNKTASEAMDLVSAEVEASRYLFEGLIHRVLTFDAAKEIAELSLRIQRLAMIGERKEFDGEGYWRRRARSAERRLQELRKGSGS